MSKSTVTRVFIAGLIAVAAGAILIIAAVSLAFVGNVFITSGRDVVDVRPSALAWSLLGLGIVGGVGVIGGLITGLVAWIGALLNASQLESKTWFAVLLLTGAALGERFGRRRLGADLEACRAVNRGRLRADAATRIER